MSERTRQNQPPRRYPQINPHQTSSLNNYHQNNNRSTYHGNQNENYSTSNCRNSSTSTTATTNPSITSPYNSSSDECGVSICYSYLIAIFSSFLVVLGIYLSLTKFNARYLYLSLVGLSTTAIGACVYCISNLRASKLAKRKQRINSDDFILNNSGNIIDTSNSNQIASNPQNVTTIIHILNNRTLTSGSTSDLNPLTQNEDVPPAISNNENDTLSSQAPHLANELVENLANEPITENPNSINQPSISKPTTREDNSTSVTNQNTVQPIVCSTNPGQHFSPLDQLPENQSCQLSPGDTSGDFSSSTCLIEDRHNNTSEQSKIPSQLDSNSPVNNHNDNPQASTSSIQNSLETNIHQLINKPVSMEQSVELGGIRLTIKDNQLGEEPKNYSALIDLPDSTSSNLIDIAYSSNDLDQQSSSKDVPDLMDQQVSGSLVPTAPIEPQVTKRKTNHQRSAHLRRTLVMGLGGEEELIEIDEADLDNMSILPPSYESLTTATTRNINSKPV